MSSRAGACVERAGTTILELLTVVGIVTILIALLMPAIGAARAQVQRVRCESNLRQLLLAISGSC